MSAPSTEQTAAMANDNMGPLTKRIVIAFTVLALVCVCLRMVTRIKQLGRAIGWEDYTIMVSMAFSIASAIAQILQINAGLGRHTMFLPFPEGIVNVLRYLYLSVIFYNFSLSLTKISILLQYRRIFTVPEMRIPLHVVMGICVAYGITLVISAIFACVPVRAFWQILEQPNARCLPNNVMWYLAASFNIMSDLLVAILPVRVIWRLQIPKQQKIALLFILTIGWFVCIVSIIRLVEVHNLAKNTDDTTWYGAFTAYWSAIEMNMAIVCASLPALKPLFKKVIPGFSSRQRSRNYGTNSGRRPSTFRTFGGTKHSRQTVDEEVELDSGSAVRCQAYPSGSNSSGYGKNIYITRQFEQHFERDCQNSDSESQKDLVDRESQVDFTSPATAHKKS
ncbi:hypothetical protein NX059_001805 [Plenodomus lindquistii]|nr:hypothetical protein NX059_001805 [Plenodomus lindquistii]